VQLLHQDLSRIFSVSGEGVRRPPELILFPRSYQHLQMSCRGDPRREHHQRAGEVPGAARVDPGSHLRQAASRTEAQRVDFFFAVDAWSSVEHSVRKAPRVPSRRPSAGRSSGSSRATGSARFPAHREPSTALRARYAPPIRPCSPVAARAARDRGDDAQAPAVLLPVGNRYALNAMVGSGLPPTPSW